MHMNQDHYHSLSNQITFRHMTSALIRHQFLCIAAHITHTLTQRTRQRSVGYYFIYRIFYKHLTCKKVVSANEPCHRAG